jgi:hypothetical protein
MTLLNRLFGQSTPPGATSVGGTTPTKPAATASSSLAPAFEVGKAPQQAQVKKAARESEFLGENFKACLMEVGVANARGTPTFHGYGTHKPMTMSLRQELPNDRLDLVVCMNVSGHDLKDRADKDQALAARAKDNKYVIQVTRPDGSKERMTGISANGSLSTMQAISIKDMKAGVTVVEAWPEGSAGVGGYVEGRRLEITFAPPGGGKDTFG